MAVDLVTIAAGGALLLAVVAVLLAVFGGPPVALHPERKVALALIDKKELSKDSRRFRFALQSPKHILGLPVGKHISLSYTDGEGKVQSRSYTPTSSDHDKGYVDFVIKVYFANVHPKFPEGGKVSQHMESLKIGDTIDAQGPKGKLTYKGRGTFGIKQKASKGGGLLDMTVKNVGMIAGGTGITPMWQVAEAIFRDEMDNTKCSLLFANQEEGDILLRSELDAAAADNGDNFTVWYTLDRPGKGWKYSTGFVTKDMIEKHLPPPGPDTLILLCGPPPMLKFACIPALEELGYTEDMYFKF